MLYLLIELTECVWLVNRHTCTTQQVNRHTTQLTHYRCTGAEKLFDLLVAEYVEQASERAIVADEMLSR